MRELFLAVHRSTERKSARGYDQVWEFFQTKENERQGRLCLVLYEGKTASLFSCFRSAKAFGVAFCYKDCFGEPPLRPASAQRVDWMTVEAAVPAAKRRVLQKCRRPAFATLRRGKHACHDSCYLSEIGSAAVMIWRKRGSPCSGYFLTWEILVSCSELG